MSYQSPDVGRAAVRGVSYCTSGHSNVLPCERHNLLVLLPHKDCHIVLTRQVSFVLVIHAILRPKVNEGAHHNIFCNQTLIYQAAISHADIYSGILHALRLD